MNYIGKKFIMYNIDDSVLVEFIIKKQTLRIEPEQIFSDGFVPSKEIVFVSPDSGGCYQVTDRCKIVDVKENV